MQASEAQARQALAQYEKAILVAFKEVEDGLIAVQKTRERRDAQEQQVKALQSASNFATQRYQGGRANYLDVLTAQRNLFDAELSLAKTRRGQLVSIGSTLQSAGRGVASREACRQRAYSTGWSNSEKRIVVSQAVQRDLYHASRFNNPVMPLSRTEWSSPWTTISTGKCPALPTVRHSIFERKSRF